MNFCTRSTKRHALVILDEANRDSIKKKKNHLDQSPAAVKKEDGVSYLISIA
jgi:hypothetical protein